MAFAAGAYAQSIPTEKEIIRALSPRAGGFSRTRSFTGARGVKVTGAEKSAPSIDLKVSFAFDSARLDNESLLTLDALGRALASDALKGQRIEILGHTDAKGTAEYNEALSQRRAAAVVSYIVRNFKLDASLISSKGDGRNVNFWTRAIPKTRGTGGSKYATSRGRPDGSLVPGISPAGRVPKRVNWSEERRDGHAKAHDRDGGGVLAVGSHRASPGKRAGRPGDRKRRVRARTRAGQPLNDAGDIGAALGRLGFAVTKLENANYDELRLGLRAFTRAAATSEVALIFYAGHGIEVDKRTS